MLGDFVILLKIVEKMCLVSYVFSFYLLVLLKFVKLTLFMFYRFFFLHMKIFGQKALFELLHVARSESLDQMRRLNFLHVV